MEWTPRNEAASRPRASNVAVRARLSPITLAALAALSAGFSFAPADAEARPGHGRHRGGGTVRGESGIASVYSALFNGRRMANGERFNPSSDSAASRTLPLGTVARVTNLENGRHAVVRFKDRGPYVGGRVADLSPHTARALGMGTPGLIRVAVTVIRVPRRQPG